MRSSSKELIEHHDCPASVARELELAGGLNPFGEPNFRVIWGYNRIVPMHGNWQEIEQFEAKLTDKLTGFSQTRKVTKLVREVVETRMVPRYLPGNCWHLEKWCETTFTREQWEKAGEEVIDGKTIFTAGPYPEKGEYEICFPLTHDGTINGTAIPLVTDVVADIVNQIRRSKEMFNLVQRAAAIAQRLEREDRGFVRVAEDMLKDSLRPFAGETFIVKP